MSSLKILLASKTRPLETNDAASDDPNVYASSTDGTIAFKAALATADIEITQISSDQCERGFPSSVKTLRQYGAVVLSNVGALSLLRTPETRAGRSGVNRLEVLKTYVEKGGGLLMTGGYMGFQGMFGDAKFFDTPVEDVLPVRCLPYGDGVEMPEGQKPTLYRRAHPILAGIDKPLPAVLGLNKVSFRHDAPSELIATCDYRQWRWPLLATRYVGKGRTVAWATDIGPHWLSAEFLNWPHYGRLMTNMILWASGRHTERSA